MQDKSNYNFKKLINFIVLINIKIVIFSFLWLFHCSRHDVTPITMALNGASSSPAACLALSSMLSRNALNPADISVLYRNYSANDPPAIELIRNPQFLGKIYWF